VCANLDTSAARRARTPAARQAAQRTTAPSAAPATLPAPSLLALVRSPHIRGRGNGPAWQAAVLQLQRAQGNQATRRLLQRRPAPLQRQPAAPPASSTLLAQELQTVIDGATWKEIRKRVYPKESAAGVQRAKDRKAGKLPDLTGLGRIKTLEHFAAAVQGIQKKWSTFASADDRVQEVGKAANVELASADVPTFLAVDKAPMVAKGRFLAGDWKYEVNEALVTGKTLSNAEAGELANVTLHESRHAEQHFLAARFAAGIQKKKAAVIAADEGIDKTIADKAVAKKMDAGTDKTLADMGKQMYKAMDTDKATNQATSDDVLAAIGDLDSLRTDAETALSNLKAGASAKTIAEAQAKRDALRAQIALVEKRYALYRQIPYEADSHEVGDAAEQAFKGWP
jgi:hypothetical protein